MSYAIDGDCRCQWFGKLWSNSFYSFMISDTCLSTVYFRSTYYKQQFVCLPSDPWFYFVCSFHYLFFAASCFHAMVPPESNQRGWFWRFLAHLAYNWILFEVNKHIVFESFNILLKLCVWARGSASLQVNVTRVNNAYNFPWNPFTTQKRQNNISQPQQRAHSCFCLYSI